MTEGALLEAVAEVAAVGGAVAMRRFGSDLRVEKKGDGSPVSVADRAAETAMREWIARRFPRDGLVGEELGEQRGTSGRRWILDPIDGTRSYVDGNLEWGTLAAVATDDRVLAGAIFCPALSELVCAAREQGCWHNGVRSRVSDVSDVASARVGLNDCYGYVLVATGRAEIMLDPTMMLWDVAALQPVIEEAGGVFTDWEGRSIPFGESAIATNRALSRNARELITGIR
jgi:histidinol-phosphatase